MSGTSGTVLVPSDTDQVEQMQALITMLQENAATVQTSLQVAWMFLNACLIFLMQVRLLPCSFADVRPLVITQFTNRFPSMHPLIRRRTFLA